MSFLLMCNYKMAAASPSFLFSSRQEEGAQAKLGTALLAVDMSESLPSICHNEEQHIICHLRNNIANNGQIAGATNGAGKSRSVYRESRINS